MHQYVSVQRSDEHDSQYSTKQLLQCNRLIPTCNTLLHEKQGSCGIKVDLTPSRRISLVTDFGTDNAFEPRHTIMLLNIN